MNDGGAQKFIKHYVKHVQHPEISVSKYLNWFCSLEGSAHLLLLKLFKLLLLFLTKNKGDALTLPAFLRIPRCTFRRISSRLDLLKPKPFEKLVEVQTVHWKRKRAKLIQANESQEKRATILDIDANVCLSLAVVLERNNNPKEEWEWMNEKIYWKW